MNAAGEQGEVTRVSAREQLVELGLINDVERFVARILRDKHREALAAGTPDGARVILEVAQWFADDLLETDPRFDRNAFIHSILENAS